MLKKVHILICVTLLIGITWVFRSSAQEGSEVLSEMAVPYLESGEEELSYDDGGPSDKLLGTPGDPVVFSVCFTPSSYPCTLKKVKFNLSWVQNYSFKVHVYQQENDSTPPVPELIESFTAQASERGWYIHDISDLDVTIESGNFAIGIEISDFGFFLYTDEDPPIANRSWSITNPDDEESSWNLNNSYNFMIRAIVEDDQPALTTTVTSTSTSTIGQNPETTTTVTEAITTTVVPNPETTTTTIGPNTTTTTQKICLSEEIYGEDSAETELLRYIRDTLLSRTSEGRELIKMYYHWSPVIVKIMAEDDEFQEEIKEMIDEALLLMVDHDR